VKNIYIYTDIVE